MPRSIEISIASEKTERLVRRLRDQDGVVGMALHRGTSIDPEGDILTVHATNEGARTVLEVLADLNVAEGGSIKTSEVKALITPAYQNGIDRESNETIWDEMAFLLRRETNLGVNYLLLMALAGSIAATGLWTDTLHIVVGAMVIAPAFEPLVRIPFGWIAGPRALASRGIMSSIAGYLALAVGAALVFWLLAWIDTSRSTDLDSRQWVKYWSSVTTTGVVVALLAGVAGALTVVSQKSVLTTGVMIALALIPAASIAGMATAAGDFELAGRGLTRWAVDAGCLIVSSTIVLGLKQVLVHRRTALS